MSTGHFKRRSAKLCFGIFMAMNSATLVFAQSGDGAVSGRIAEAASGRSLEGAIVTVADERFRDFTDASGRFSIADVPPGTYPGVMLISGVWH